jgi:hypothetical protein
MVSLWVNELMFVFQSHCFLHIVSVVVKWGGEAQVLEVTHVQCHFLNVSRPYYSMKDGLVRIFDFARGTSKIMVPRTRVYFRDP